MTNALQAVLDRAAKGEAETPLAQPAPPRDAAKAEPPARPRPVARRRPAEPPKEGAEKFFRPARVGKRFVGAHFDPEVARQLKMLAAEDDKTIQELLEDAVDLLFVKAGKARIADLVRKP
jgi:hypothetical protein